jgi:hypothetical protein
VSSLVQRSRVFTTVLADSVAFLRLIQGVERGVDPPRRQGRLGHTYVPMVLHAFGSFPAYSPLE